MKRATAVAAATAVGVLIASPASAWDNSASANCDTVTVANLTSQAFIDARPDDANNATAWAQAIRYNGSQQFAPLGGAASFPMVHGIDTYTVHWPGFPGSSETKTVALPTVDDCTPQPAEDLQPEDVMIPAPQVEQPADTVTKLDDGPATELAISTVTVKATQPEQTQPMETLPVTGASEWAAGIGAALLGAGIGLVRLAGRLA